MENFRGGGQSFNHVHVWGGFKNSSGSLLEGSIKICFKYKKKLHADAGNGYFQTLQVLSMDIGLSIQITDYSVIANIPVCQIYKNIIKCSYIWTPTVMLVFNHDSNLNSIYSYKTSDDKVSLYINKILFVQNI